MAELVQPWIRMQIGQQHDGNWVLTHSPNDGKTLKIEIDHHFASKGIDAIFSEYFDQGEERKFVTDEEWLAMDYLPEEVAFRPLNHSQWKETFEQMLKQWKTLQMFVDFAVSA